MVELSLVMKKQKPKNSKQGRSTVILCIDSYLVMREQPYKKRVRRMNQLDEGRWTSSAAVAIVHQEILNAFIGLVKMVEKRK